ncbi:ABC transporter permease [Streptomyces sp. AK02-01A]|uniref:ABC transporter permease n=1 Tax=Streptomyces sp. AK02-01A TaxID=3028648 RepID=UPI0029AE2EC4|nr:ABC transporter permease [Streptomyces sp. AK02-01A]MDX3850978.1 ABC transporter permease [Streptomyces sp. AK02-01A]
MTGPGAPPPLDPGWYYARPATQPPTAPPPRPAHRTPGAHLRHTGTLVRRNLLHMRDDPSSLLDSVLMPGIFTVLFVYVFGGAIAGSRAGYIQYMIPGLLGILSLMLATSVSTGMNTDFQTGLMDRFRTLPISPVSVLAARLISETVRSLLSLSVLMNFAMLLGMRVPAGPLVVLAVDGLIILFGTAMVWISMLVGMSMRSAQSAQAVSGLVAVPLQFGSSIFAPVSTMPDWLVSFTRYNPLSALADACRELINEKPAGHSVLVVLIWSCGITVVAAPLALARFRKRT